MGHQARCPKNNPENLSITIISQNVRHFTVEKNQELFNRMAQKEILAAALQETWLTKDTVEKDEESGYIILNHGPEIKPCKRGALGVAIVLSPIAVRAWEKGGSKVEYFGERIIAVRLQLEDSIGKPLSLYIASAYAPDSSRPQSEKDQFAEDLQCCFDARGDDDEIVPVICMDCNASIGIRKDNEDNGIGQDRVRGKFGILHENAAGHELHAMMAINEMCAVTTFFKKREYATWYHPASKKGHQIDHIIVRQEDMKRVRDAGFIGWRGVDSDHRAVYIRLALARYLKRKVEGPKPMRIDREKLFDPETAEQYRASVREHVDKLRAERELSTENSTKLSDLALLEKAMQEASKEHLKSTKRKKPGWYMARADKLEPLVRNRNTAQAEYNANPSDENKRRLKLARALVKKEVKRAIKAWIETVVLDVNHLLKKGSVTPKEAWDAVRLLQRGFDSKVPVASMKFRKPGGTATESPEEAAEVMVAYLKTTFSKDGTFDEEAVKSVPQRRSRPEMDRPPDFDEYTSALSKLSNGKAPGDDGNFVELYKALLSDESTQNLLFDVLLAFWKSGSYPGDNSVTQIAEELHEPTIERAKMFGWNISWEQSNPKKFGSKSYVRYENYKNATSIQQALDKGATTSDLKWDLQHKFLKLHDPALKPKDDQIAPLADDRQGLIYDEWLIARLKLLPKKGDLTLCKNWRGISLLDVASKVMSSILVKRMQEVLKECGLELQSGFTPDRGTIDGLFSVFIALQKRKEHNMDSWILFVDLVKAFDSVPRAALFAVLRRFGLPDHFINLVIRLHKDAKVKVKIGNIDYIIDSSIGVRQGSCEGPVLFLFIMQAAMETLKWPEGVEKPQFRTRQEGKSMGERWNRKRGATTFELWASLFADDCAVIFNSRQELISGTQHLYSHMQKFGLEMHVGRGETASKTEAMFCPRPRKAYDDENTGRFNVDGDGFIDFTQEFKYLGSLITSSLTSDADVEKRIKAATAIFGAMNKSIFSRKDIELRTKGHVYNALVLSILLYGSECWALREDLFKRLRSFHNRCVRTMCRVTIAHTIRCRIKTTCLLKRLGILSIDEYYHHRLLRWAGHVARMDMNRTPRKLITGWVENPRPRGCPYMTWGRTLKKALKIYQLNTDFSEWSKIAQDRKKWKEIIALGPNSENDEHIPTARDERAARRNQT